MAARKTILADRGYQVTTACSGEQALEIFESQLDSEPFHMVVTDYRMPGIWGDEVVRRIRSLAPRVPVVILSGYATSLELTPELTGADLVLAKGPREQHELVRAVETLLPASVKPQPKKPATERESSSGGRFGRPRRRTGTS